MKKFLVCLIIINFSLFLNTYAKKEQPKEIDKPEKMNSSVFSGLSFRALGPGVTSGRIADIAVNKDNHN